MGTHRGIPNDILVHLNDELSIRYNHTSIMEKHSILTGLHLFFNEVEFLPICHALFPAEDTLYDQNAFLQIVISTILCTDTMNKERLNLLQQRWQDAFEKQLVDKLDKQHIIMNNMQQLDEQINTFEIDNMCYPFIHTTSTPLHSLQQSVLIQHILQIADVAYIFQDWNIFLKFNLQLELELYDCFKSGWMEDVTLTWYDRTKCFIEDYALPLSTRFHTSCYVLNNNNNNNSTDNANAANNISKVLVDNANMNYKNWLEKGQMISQIFKEGIEKEHPQDVIMAMILV